MNIIKNSLITLTALFLFSFYAEESFAGKLSPKPVFTKMDIFEINIKEFGESTKKLEESLKEMTQIFANERNLSEQKRKSLLYTYTSINKLIALSKDLAKFNTSVLLIFKGHEEINLDMQPAPPSSKELQKILNNSAASIKSIVTIFMAESGQRTPRYQIDSIKKLNFNFYNHSLSSENLEKSLYNVLKSYSIASTIIELHNINQSIMTYQLDLNEQLPKLYESSNLLNAEKLVQSYKNNWAGPYISYQISDTPGLLKHSIFGNIAIYETNNNKWKDPRKQNAKCNKKSNCFAYICFTKLTQMAKVNLEMKIDHTNSPNSGKFRYSSNNLGCFKGSRIK